MSYSEYKEWQEYYNIEPFYADRIEMQIAATNTILSNTAGAKSKLKDFVISRNNNEPNDLTSQVKALFG